jgi:D-sedoheptulose 7-phosphate isomerase
VIDRHLISLAIALQHIDNDVPRLQAWGQKAASVLIAGGRLFTYGSGNSAQQARHLVSELAHTEDDRPPLAVATLPACLDDDDDCQSGDIAICLSTPEIDGRVASVATAAREAGMTSWAITGPAPNAVAAAWRQ